MLLGFTDALHSSADGDRGVCQQKACFLETFLVKSWPKI